MEATVLFVNATKIHQFNVRNSEIKKKHPLFSAKLSENVSVKKMKKNSVRWVCVQFLC